MNIENSHTTTAAETYFPIHPQATAFEQLNATHLYRDFTAVSALSIQEFHQRPIIPTATSERQFLFHLLQRHVFSRICIGLREGIFSRRSI
jgi:hypothetical protein